jgi:hypothetical protein
MTGLRIVNLQRQLRERGRIRLGVSDTRNGKKVPRKLDRFLFSAPDEQTVRLAAQLYGGEPEPWADGGKDRWRVISDVDSVPVIFPTQMSFSQAYEQWAGGFCTRRCDGVVARVPSRTKGPRFEEEDCACDPDMRDCQTTTNLSVILPDLPGLGVWRLVSHGYYAATELGAAVELIESALDAGMRVPARLFLERREVRRLVEGKPQVRKFVVPVLDLDMSVGALGAGVHGPASVLPQGDGAPALAGYGGTAALTTGQANGGAVKGVANGGNVAQGWRPVAQGELPAAPLVSVKDQLDDVEREPKRRANAAPVIKPTGARPRKAVDVDAGTCDLCAKEYGTGGLKKNPEPGGSKYVHTACLEADADAWAQAAEVAEGAGAPASVPAPSAPAPADSQGQGQPAGEAQPDGGSAPAVEPSPAGNGGTVSRTSDRPMTHGQHKKLMALQAEAFPAAPGMTGAETDAYRKEQTLALCAVLGQPGLTSRSEISHASATVVIDAMEAIKAGELTWDGETLGTKTEEGA